jgi:hypothetical protein
MLNSERELLRFLPRVLRARDSRLYLEGGKRLVDLWLHGGRAILGHKPPRVLLELKNAAERGLFSPLPHSMEKRFIKALGEIFPGRAFRIYPDPASLRRVLEKTGFVISNEQLAISNEQKAGSNGQNARGVYIWRPFLEAPSLDTSAGDGGKAPVMIPVLPLPLGPEVLVLEKSMDASFPAGELIPPVLLAPAARALYNLSAALKAKELKTKCGKTPGLGRQRYHKIEKILDRQKPETGLWQRRGIYLMLEPGMDRGKYEALFRRFLEGGFLIPPSPEEPAILPVSMSDGEESKLALLINEIQ